MKRSIIVKRTTLSRFDHFSLDRRPDITWRSIVLKLSLWNPKLHRSRFPRPLKDKIFSLSSAPFPLELWKRFNKIWQFIINPEQVTQGRKELTMKIFYPLKNGISHPEHRRWKPFCYFKLFFKAIIPLPVSFLLYAWSGAIKDLGSRGSKPISEILYPVKGSRTMLQPQKSLPLLFFPLDLEE